MDLSTIGQTKGFCWQTAGMWQFAGWAVLVLKIVIPAILIILGIVALGKAVIAADDKEIKTAVNSLIKKFIAAVVIFFIPQIVSALFSVVAGFKDVRPDYEVCVKCITNPTKKTNDAKNPGCQDAVDDTTGSASSSNATGT